MSSSSNSKATIETLVLLLLIILSPLPFSGASDLRDEDGNPIKNGAHYYIIEVDTKQSLTFTQIFNQCPLYITLSPEGTLGTPVKIYDPQNLSPTFELNDPLNLAFKGSNTSPCKDSSMVWQCELLTKDLPYITTGADIVEVARRHFRIVKSNAKTDNSRRSDDIISMYEIEYRIAYNDDLTCIPLALIEDGRLSIDLNYDAVKFKFRKAIVLELPSSSIA